MELLLILLPLLAIGLISDGSGGGGGDDGAAEPPPPESSGAVQRDNDAAGTFAGTATDDLVLAAGGADSVSGDAGNDLLAGEAGADTLRGGAGDDVLLGAWGNDVLDGGGNDDLLAGGSGNDLLAGGAGNDLLFGSTGRDTLLGDDGDDELIGIDPFAGLAAADLAGLDTAGLSQELRGAFAGVTDTDIRRIVAGVTNQNLAEDAGPDRLEGGAGNDILIGDDGDLLTGGTGIDNFGVLITPGAEIVTILDFDPTAETLVLQVQGPVTGPLTYQNDAFGDGVDVLYNGLRIASLEGVSAGQILPGSLAIGSFGA
jgi:Ca2+-binding RTX toxin-like protein